MRRIPVIIGAVLLSGAICAPASAADPAGARPLAGVCNGAHPGAPGAPGVPPQLPTPETPAGVFVGVVMGAVDSALCPKPSSWSSASAGA
jgi:hypothetical protein